MPGPYRFDRTPYLREIIDCFDINSDVREVAVQKGAQLGLTTLLENIIFYGIDEVKTASMMLLTADDGLAKLRLDQFIMPMINESGLLKHIRSNDTGNSRKSGATTTKVSWYGGGFLLPVGAVNPAKSRSIPIRFLLRDEIDAFKDVVGDDGDPLAVSEKRTLGFKQSYKILDISTPLLAGRSKIEKRFKRGDQRYYFVCCLNCNAPQRMRWQVDLPNNKRAGIKWDTEDGRLVPGSARWVCEKCFREHIDSEKSRLFAPENGAKWIATAKPHSPNIRSYHLAGLYSPAGMNNFDAMVLDWLEAWDTPNNRVKDPGKLQAFYNMVLGDVYEPVVQRLKFEQVSAHRRQAYRFGEIPNTWAKEHCGGPVLFLVCAVDVHASNLAVAVYGWCRDRRAVLIQYDRLEGDTSRRDDPGTWGELRSRLLNREYRSDDGFVYRVATCVVDSGYQKRTGEEEEGTDVDEEPGAGVVIDFCDSFLDGGVVPIRGNKQAVAGGYQEYKDFTTKSGSIGFHVTVNYYKDRWYPALKKEWSGLGLQPETFFNAPMDISDPQLKELTAESKEIPKKSTDNRLQWIRRGENALWDLLVYSNFAHDLLARTYQVNHLGHKIVDLDKFWDTCERENLFRFLSDD